MSYKFPLTLILVFLSFSLKAQDNEQQIEEPEELSSRIKRYKYDVGIDMQWLFARTINNYYPDYSESYTYRGGDLRLFGRINKSKQIEGKYKTRRYAYRFGLGLGGNHSQYNDVQSGSAMQYQVYNGGIYLAPEIGYEVQTQLQKFQLFYGLSLGLSYSKDSYDTYLRNSQSSEFIKYETRNKSYEFSLSPLLGMKFFIHSRVSVSSESRLNLRYFSHDITNGIIDYREKRKGLGYNITALHALNINYHFSL